MTRTRPLIYLAAIALLAPSTCQGSLDRLLYRRQSGEAEQESKTPKSQTDSAQQQPPAGASSAPNTIAGSPPARLYPDLPQGQGGGPNYLPPFNARPQYGGPMPTFVPFGMVSTRLNADQQPGPFGPRILPPLRPMSPAERLESQSFTDGLGKRLLSLIGIDTGNQQQNETTDGQAGGLPTSIRSDNNNNNNNMNHMRVLENSAVLQELNKRVNMVMSGLSKIYNSTVHEQLSLLNERFKKEAANSTNPWQQRVAQQVPMFFEQMAGKVSQAQEQLNRVWHDITQVAQGNGSFFERQPASQGGDQPTQAPFFNAIHQFIHRREHEPFFDGGAQNGGGGDFVDQINRSLGIQDGQSSATNGSQPNLGARLREFWHVRVQPQIGMVRNQMARVWRDLTTSGALSPETIARSRMHSVSASGSNSSNQNSTNDLVDSLLKEADTEASEFALITPRNDSSSSPESGNGEQVTPQSPPASGLPKLSPQMQNRLAAMQRDLNQLWQGLTSSLQNAVNNVRDTLNPRPQFWPPGPSDGPMNNPNQSGPQETDPEQNAINDKVKDLSKLQSEADVIYDAVQQRQREAQQRQTFADRFRGFINNVDLNRLNQLPEQIGERMNRFGAVIGNFWNTIPERLENRRAQRQNQENQAKLEAQVNAKLSASTPASVSENTVMSGN